MDLHPDFKDLLAECVAAGLEFVVLGGYAVGFHATPRATKDIDLLVLAEPENLTRLAAALGKFGAPPNVVQAARSAGPDDVLYFGIPPVRVDIVTAADGIDTRAAIARAVVAQLGDLQVPIISLDDLIENKRAAGRKQDLADLDKLENVRAARRAK